MMTTKTIIKNPKESQSTILVRLAIEGAILFHDEQGNGYAQILNGNHSEFHKVRSSSFRRWLRQEYLRAKKSVPGASAVSDALENLEGLAEFQGEQIEPRIRIGTHYGTVWLDLGQDEWEPIAVDGEGWGLIRGELAGVVKFHRPKGFLPIPVPEPDGSLNELRSFLNVQREQDFVLIVAWLLGAMMPVGPYPILVLHGEQGSAKSTTAKLLKSLIDPAAAVFRSYPREERDLVVSASNSWVLVFDNMSGLPVWMSDALCRISTGGGFCTRQLYTGREEEIFNDTRPVILNGISDVVVRHDLLDRCLFVTLPPISDDQRKSEKEIFAAFKKAHPRILGALLSAVSMAVKNRSKMKLESLPRMADFALWVAAAEQALPWGPGSFVEIYSRNRTNVYRASIEADLFASSLVEWFVDQAGNNSEAWIGTASELGGIIEDHHCSYDQKKIDALKRRRGWPGDGIRISKKLRHISGFLRKVGIEVEIDRRTGKKREVLIKRVSENNVTNVTNVIRKEDQDVASDVASDVDDDSDFLTSPENCNDINGNDVDDVNDVKSGISFGEDEIPF